MILFKTLSIPVSFDTSEHLRTLFLQKSTRAHASGIHSQMWVISKGQLNQWMPTLRHMEKYLKESLNPPTTETNNQGYAISFGKDKQVISIGAFGLLVWCFKMNIDMFGTNSWGNIQEAVKRYSDLYPITNTSIFLGFSALIATAIPVASLCAAYGFATSFQESQNAPEKGISRFVTIDITPKELIGTTSHPGLLFQTMNGFLIICHLAHLKEGALSLIETMMSNKGRFSFLEKDNTWQTKIYTGQIIISCQNIFEFSPISRNSGRTHELSLLPERDLTLDAAAYLRFSESSNLEEYKSLSIPKEDELKADPFHLFIGREKEIAQLKTIINNWLTLWKNRKPGEAFPPSVGILVCDNMGAQYGQGKTSLLEAAKSYADIKTQELNIPFPGIQTTREKGDKVSASVIDSLPPRLAAVSFFNVVFAASSISFLVTISFLFTVLYKSNQASQASNQSKSKQAEFDAQSSIASFVIGSIVLAGLKRLNTIHTDQSGHILLKPSHTLSHVELASACNSQEWVGIRQSNTVPQKQYQPTTRGGLHALCRMISIESGALDIQPSDSNQEQENKKSLTHSIASALSANETQLAKDGPPIPISSLIFISSNRPLLKIEPELIDLCICIPLESVVNFDIQIDKPRLLTQLKMENQKLGGKPWTKQALEAFVDAIQFEGILPPGKALITRQYFQDLLPFIHSLSIRDKNEEVTSQEFKKAWKVFCIKYEDYLKSILKPDTSAESGHVQDQSDIMLSPWN